MITTRQAAFTTNVRNNEWVCLSTDAKPISTTLGYKLYNGDIMLEMDTGNTYNIHCHSTSVINSEGN